MTSELTATGGIAPTLRAPETTASPNAVNATTSFVVYTTLVTSLASPTETALPSHVTASTSTLATRPIVISQDDIPPGWIPDMQRADTTRFHNEMIFSLGVLGMGITAVWLWSLCGCWWRGDCFWHCDQGTCWGILKKWRKKQMKKKRYQEQGIPGLDERWRCA